MQVTFTARDFRPLPQVFPKMKHPHIDAFRCIQKKDPFRDRTGLRPPAVLERHCLCCLAAQFVRIFTNMLPWMSFLMTSTNLIDPGAKILLNFLGGGIQKDMVPNGCQNAKMPTHLERKKDDFPR